MFTEVYHVNLSILFFMRCFIMCYEVVGYSTIRYKDKNGNPAIAYRLYLTKDVQPMPGRDGKEVADVFCPEAYYIPHIHDVVRLVYMPGYDGKARLTGVEIV